MPDIPIFVLYNKYMLSCMDKKSNALLYLPHSCSVSENPWKLLNMGNSHCYCSYVFFTVWLALLKAQVSLQLGKVFSSDNGVSVSIMYSYMY